MIKHIVMWKLKEETDGKSKKDNAKKMQELLEGLRGKIDGVKSIELGINLNNTTAAYDVVLYSEFDSMEALDAYQVHPEHVKAAGFVKSITIDRAVVDYEV